MSVVAVLLGAGAAPPPAKRVGSDAERRVVPAAREALPRDVDWWVFRLVGEDATPDEAFDALCESLASVPPEVDAVEVDRLESSPTGERHMSVIRAVRPNAVAGFDARRTRGRASRAGWCGPPGWRGGCRAAAFQVSRASPSGTS